jgi:hypothetical protein
MIIEAWLGALLLILLPSIAVIIGIQWGRYELLKMECKDIKMQNDELWNEKMMEQATRFSKK